ncbi:phage repressor protein C with HTH and peptisase S24 domain [Orbus hercynius]|uniref:Phage repressor protein C with HTH and peptisase S24 domain n=1 Tax=Orbus hercynius TaxID=593135 RepID=A0A495RGZ2_9GAMM|nr:S24 family peptidase [Orbus hercynius]RKS86028.1 phage repressor protein C with HTH and peptisase S24 domain [Orbus hercynius]
MIINKSVQTFKNRLTEVMQGDSVSVFAKKCNMSETVIRDYLSGKTYPSLSRLASIAEKCNVSYCWLATGHKLEDISDTENDNVYNEYIHRIPVYAKQLPTIEEARTQKYVRGTPPVMNYPALDGWLEYRGLDAKKLIIYWAKGDLMEPEIKHNNGLIINTDIREVVDGAIYLLEYKDMTLLRRIRLTLDGWELQCNNDRCATISVLRKDFKQYKVVGCVVQIIKDLY